MGDRGRPRPAQRLYRLRHRRGRDAHAPGRRAVGPRDIRGRGADLLRADPLTGGRASWHGGERRPVQRLRVPGGRLDLQLCACRQRRRSGARGGISVRRAGHRRRLVLPPGRRVPLRADRHPQHGRPRRSPSRRDGLPALRGRDRLHRGRTRHQDGALPAPRLASRRLHAGSGASGRRDGAGRHQGRGLRARARPALRPQAGGPPRGHDIGLGRRGRDRGGGRPGRDAGRRPSAPGVLKREPDGVHRVGARPRGPGCAWSGRTSTSWRMPS